MVRQCCQSRAPSFFAPREQVELSDLPLTVRRGESPRTGGFGRKEKRQQLRARPAIRRLAENAHKPRSGAGDRRLYAECEKLRCAHSWLLRRRQIDLCGADAKRIYSCAS